MSRRRIVPPHGDRRRYAYWHCGCAPCREAERLYEKRHRENRAVSAFVDPTGTRRLVQGLVAMGYSYRAIGDAMDRAETWVCYLTRVDSSKGILRRTAVQVRLAAHQLLAQSPPQGRAATYAKTVAARHGWHPLGVWDDINDPECQPIFGDVVVVDEGDVDEVKVQRALRGFKADLTDAETAATLRAAMTRGTTFTRMCRDMGLNRTRAQRLLGAYPDRDGEPLAA